MRDDERPEEQEITPELIEMLESRLGDIGVSAYVTEGPNGQSVVDVVENGENVSSIGSVNPEDAEDMRVMLLIAMYRSACAMASYLQRED